MLSEIRDFGGVSDEIGRCERKHSLIFSETGAGGIGFKEKSLAPKARLAFGRQESDSEKRRL